jgi:hypothetical protein
MSKILAILACLKTALIAVSIGLARGDMLPVIVISGLFSIAQLGAKPVGQTMPRDPMVVSPRPGSPSISSQNAKILKGKVGLSREAKELTRYRAETIDQGELP